MGGGEHHVRLVVGIAITATSSFAQTLPTAVFCDRPEAANSAVPGLGPFRFGPISWASVAVSPNGRWWVLDAFINAPLDRDEVLIRGSGVFGAGAKVFAREGDPSFQWGRTYQGLLAQTGVSDSGLVAFGGDLSGDSSNDQFIAVWPDDSGGGGGGGVDTGIGVVALEDQPSPVFDPAGRWDRLDSAVISGPEGSDPQAGFRVLGIKAPSSFSDRGVVLSGRVLARKDTTAPVGQSGPGNPQRPWSTFVSDTLRISSDGGQWMVMGTLAGSVVSANVCAVNNRVVAQQGQLLSDLVGGGAISSSIVGMRWPVMAPSGRWAMIAELTDGSAVVLRNAASPFPPGPTDRTTAMVTATGLPITPSSDATYDNSWYFGTFFALAMNSQGDVVVGGITNEVIGRSGVLVLYDHTGGSRVLLREGEPVDLNGDGLANDRAFIDSWNPGAIGRGIALTDDGTLVMLLSIRDHANPDDAGPGGTQITQALAVYPIPDFPTVCPCPADFDRSGGTPDVADIVGFFTAWLAGEPGADADCTTGTPEGADIETFFRAWLVGGCP